MVERIKAATTPEPEIRTVEVATNATIEAGVSNYVAKGGVLQHVGMLSITHQGRKTLRFVCTGPYDTEADARRAGITVRDAIAKLLDPNAVGRDIPALSRVAY